MRYLSVGLAVTAIIVVGGCINSEAQQPSAQADAIDAVEWKEFSSERGNFSLLMPGAPEEKKSVIQTQLGPLDSYSFLLKARQGNRKTAYLISYSDYPSGHTQKFNSTDFLEKTWQGSFSNLGDRLVYKKNITLNNFAGLEFQYRGESASTSIITGRNYLVNDRIYQLAAVMSKELVDRGGAQKYLDSFRLLK